MEFIHLLTESYKKILSFSNTLLHPLCTWNLSSHLADAYKLDLVITFKDLKEFLLSNPSLEEGDVISLRYNVCVYFNSMLKQ